MTVPPFPQALLDSIPLRVSDPNGAPGDRVNFIVIGSEDQMKAAFKAAGWVIVDRTNQEAVISGLLASLSKEAYVTIPMSELRLYGRAQDVGYAQADPLQVAASRHHFRLWKAPFALDGQTVWVGEPARMISASNAISATTASPTRSTQTQTLNAITSATALSRPA